MINQLTSHWYCKLISLPVFILGFLLVFSSCIKEEFNADILDPSLQINPGMAAPIGWARYQLDEILTDSLNADELLIDENGFISFVYKQDLYSLQASELISLPDATVSTFSFLNPTGVPLNLNNLQNDTVFRDSIEFSIPINGLSGAEIDSIMLQSGFISYTVSSHYPGMMWDTKILLKDIPNSQVTLSDIHPSGTDSLSLSGKTLPLHNTPPSQNAISIVVILTLYNSNLTINPGPILDIDIELTELVYSRLYGYLGQFDLDIGPQSFPVSFYNRIPEGDFHFHNPQLKLEFMNSFGIPVQISMNNFQATGSGGQITPMTGSGVPDLVNPKILAYPQYGQEGESIPDNIVLIPDNTNLFDVLETSPTEITVEVNGTTNPAGPPGKNFILDTSQIRVSTELLLPMEGYADLILITDTLDFIMGEFFDNPPEEIIRLIFRINYLHQFPVDVATQIFFADESYSILDSLFHDLNNEKRIVQGAPVNADGVADEFEADPIEIELSREQIDNISESHYIIFNGRVRTTGYEPPPPANVRFYSFYYFFAHIGAITELEINSNDY